VDHYIYTTLPFKPLTSVVTPNLSKSAWKQLREKQNAANARAYKKVQLLVDQHTAHVQSKT